MTTIFTEKETTKDKIERSFMNNFMPEEITDNEVALTMNGKIAIKRSNGDYVIYNEEKNIIENQLDLVIEDFSQMLMLVPTKEVQEGDIIKLKKTYYYVKGIRQDGKISGINLNTGNVNNIVEELNVITGTNTYKKVVNLMTGFNGTEDGHDMNNLLPLMLLKDSKSEGNGFDFGKLLMMQAMQGSTTETINPMMLMFLKDKGSNNFSDLLMLQAMQGVNPLRNLFNA